MTKTIGDQVVELENFRGPLDLLLHLVREQEMEITDVALGRVCDQYLSTLERMRDLDIDIAGDFLVIASTLMLIKSRSILPREDVDLAEELDPADELITQLLEYRRFKTLSLALGRAAEDRASRFGRGLHDRPPDEERELAEIKLWDLVGTYARLVEELDLNRRFDTMRAQKPLREFIRETLDRLASREHWTFGELVSDRTEFGQVFGTFLSVLELVKTGQVDVQQESCGSDITIRLREDRDASLLSVLLHGPGPTAAGPDPEPEPEPAPPAAPVAEAGSGAPAATEPPADAG